MAVIKVHRTTAVGSETTALIRQGNQNAIAVAAIKTDLATLKAKLNLDAGVTDANYTFATIEALTAPDTILEVF